MRRSNNFSGNYIVFALRSGKPMPVNIRTGLTDLDYVEVTSGLAEKDTVLLLPSASLVQSQTDMKNRFQNMTGGGLTRPRQHRQGRGGKEEENHLRGGVFRQRARRSAGIKDRSIE